MCELPANSLQLQLYIVYLANVKHLRYNSIIQYLNIVPHIHKLAGYPNPLPGDYRIELLLRGLKRELGVAQTPVAAITPQMLLAIKHCLNFNLLLDTAFWCACLIAFYVMLRPANVTVKGIFNPDFDLQQIDLLPCSWGFLLCLRKTKTIQFRERQLEVILPRINNALCPVMALQKLKLLNPAEDPFSPLIVVAQGRALTYSVFSSKLQYFFR
ncbi:hypothetical protein SNE40_020724 [Patella caerulea]